MTHITTLKEKFPLIDKTLRLQMNITNQATKWIKFGVNKKQHTIEKKLEASLDVAEMKLKEADQSVAGAIS